MPEISETPIHCPYCGESISVLAEDSLPAQSYVEDCEVCCRPIVVGVTVGLDGEVEVVVRGEDE